MNDPKKFNVGRFNPDDTDVGTGMASAPACGDVKKIKLSAEKRVTSILLMMSNLRLMVVDQQ